MAKSVILFFFLSAITACFQNQQKHTEQAKNEQEDNQSKRIDTLCFLRTFGSANQDTSYVRIITESNKITGSFLYIPYEKDSRKGTLEGSRDGGVIKAVWKFMQEGIKDSLPVEFKIQENKLLQKEYSVDLETGRQFLSDTSRFTLEYKKVNCAF